MTFEELREAEAIRQLLHLQSEYGNMMTGWGEEFDSLVSYLAVACDADWGRNHLLEVLAARPVARTMVITGERCSGLCSDGSDSPLILGVMDALELLVPYATKKPGIARNGREEDALSVIFSGGQSLTEIMGERTGSVMAGQLNTLTGGRYRSYVQFEDCSLNTGDQGVILGGLLWSRNVRRVVFVHVVDHIARFAATVMEGWRANRDGRLSAAKEYLDAGKITEKQYQALNRPWPEIHFLPVGKFTDVDLLRGVNGISRAQEAFGPQQLPEETIIQGKRLGGEYAANRYGLECLPEFFDKSVGYACRALPPSQMLKLMGVTT